ncbi:hypothetical protein D3C81_1949600 [compost metagenome]
MQMSIHGFLLVHVLGAEAQIIRHLPFTRKGFNITFINRIIAVFLYNMEQVNRLLQGIGASGGVMKFGQRIDGKSQAVDLFFWLGRSPMLIHHPEQSAVFCICEILGQVVVGPLSHC